MPSPRLNVSEYVDGVRAGKRGILSRCITLLESTKRAIKNYAAKLFSKSYHTQGKVFRIGITGTRCWKIHFT